MSKALFASIINKNFNKIDKYCLQIKKREYHIKKRKFKKNNLFQLK